LFFATGFGADQNILCAEDDLMTEDRFLSQTELAALVGGTSHSVGKALTAAGLRNNGTPSSKAFNLGLVKQAPTLNGSGYFYVWHMERTLPFLKKGTTHGDR
jgi:hypothetical protein